MPDVAAGFCKGCGKQRVLIDKYCLPCRSKGRHLEKRVT